MYLMMQVQDVKPKSLFIYDLEFVGDVSRPHECAIWDVAFYCVRTREMFRAVVDPDPSCMVFPPPPTPECMQLTRDFLYRHRAKTFDMVYTKLVRWVYNRTHGTPVFISHNNFRSDKPVLISEIARYRMMIPTTWHFFDSLLYIRDNFDFEEYNMGYLVQRILKTKPKNAHRASTDTFHLHRILQTLTNNYATLRGELQPAQYTSLRCAQGVGKAVQKQFFDAGIYNMEMVRETVRCLYVQGACTGFDVNHLIRSWLRRILRNVPDLNRTRIQRSITA